MLLMSPYVLLHTMYTTTDVMGYDEGHEKKHAFVDRTPPKTAQMCW